MKFVQNLTGNQRLEVTQVLNKIVFDEVVEVTDETVDELEVTDVVVPEGGVENEDN